MPSFDDGNVEAIFTQPIAKSRTGDASSTDENRLHVVWVTSESEAQMIGRQEMMTQTAGRQLKRQVGMKLSNSINVICLLPGINDMRYLEMLVIL